MATKTPKPVEEHTKESQYTYNVEDLMIKFREYNAYKQSTLMEWRVIRSLYRGEFWSIFNEYLKDYSVSPDWNYFEYIVQGYLNSIYSGAFIGTLTPRHADDDNLVDKLNAFVSYNWSKWGMKNKFLHVGENGELYNLGAVSIEYVVEKFDIPNAQLEIMRARQDQ